MDTNNGTPVYYWVITKYFNGFLVIDGYNMNSGIAIIVNGLLREMEQW